MTDRSAKNDHYSQAPEDELRLNQIMGILWHDKWLLLGITFCFAVGAVFYSLTLQDYYRSKAVLAPVAESQSGIKGLMSQYGGLASLAGVNLPSQGEVSKTDLAIEMLQSKSFLTDFVVLNDFMPSVMAVKSWDKASGTLIIDSDAFDTEASQWIRDVSPPFTKTPHPDELMEVLKEQLLVVVNKKTGFITVSFDHQSPEFAMHFLSRLISAINERMKVDERERALSALSFLEGKVKENSLAEINVAIFELIQNQLQTVMLSEISEEYAFRIIDPPATPLLKIYPSRALICVVLTLFGAVFAAFITVGRRQFF